MSGTKGAAGRPGKILYIQYTNPAAYPPIEHGAVLLAEAGWDVRLVGVGLLPAARLVEHPRIGVALVPASRRGWRQKVMFLDFIRRVTFEAVRWRPNWIYASDPLATPAAWCASQLSRAAVVYHEHDCPERDGASSSFFTRIVMGFRRRLAQRARVCVAPNAGRIEALERDTGQVPHAIVWNTPLRREAVALNRGAGHGTRLLFHGSIVPARVPEAMLHALARLPATVSLRVTGYDPSGGAYVERLTHLAQTLKLGARVEFTGVLPTRAELMREGAGFDVGLSLLPLESPSVNERTMAGASNKPFDYMACGLALLVPDLPDWRAMFVDEGFGRACDPASVEGLAAAIRWFDENPDERRAMGERGRRRVLDAWHYERSFAPVSALLTGRVAGAADEQAVGDER